MKILSHYLQEILLFEFKHILYCWPLLICCRIHWLRFTRLFNSSSQKKQEAPQSSLWDFCYCFCFLLLGSIVYCNIVAFCGMFLGSQYSWCAHINFHDSKSATEPVFLQPPEISNVHISPTSMWTEESFFFFFETHKYRK